MHALVLLSVNLHTKFPKTPFQRNDGQKIYIKRWTLMPQHQRVCLCYVDSLFWPWPDLLFPESD